mmetsp:Transcript_28002/g.70872  ORF Transcript_28002/g.70872 Transcript_28002/m.70872 type:complete len:211 (+) Transcript_28002:1650-2282(+)
MSFMFFVCSWSTAFTSFSTMLAFSVAFWKKPANTGARCSRPAGENSLKYTVRSWSVYALSLPSKFEISFPNPSVSGNCSEPRNSMCSRKWASPGKSGGSLADPARTATESAARGASLSCTSAVCSPFSSVRCLILRSSMTGSSVEGSAFVPFGAGCSSSNGAGCTCIAGSCCSCPCSWAGFASGIFRYRDPSGTEGGGTCGADASCCFSL